MSLGDLVVCNETGCTTFNAYWASRLLVDEALTIGSAHHAIGRFENLLTSNAATGISVLALRGITLSARIDLSNGFSLIPFSDIPDSFHKYSAGTPNSILNQLLPPTAAVICPTKIEPLFYKVPIEGFLPPDFPTRNCYEKLNEACLPASLIGEALPEVMGYWFQFDDPALQGLFRVPGFMGVEDSLQRSLMPLAPVEIDVSDAHEMIERYLSLDANLRRTVSIAIKRYNSARTCYPRADRIVDLAISLEALLVEESVEIKHKIGLRTALLLGFRLEDRMRIRALIDALYDLRSAVVHCEQLPAKTKVGSQKKTGKSEKMSPNELVSKVTYLCRDATVKIIQRGASPNWYGIELGGELDSPAV